MTTVKYPIKSWVDGSVIAEPEIDKEIFNISTHRNYHLGLAVSEHRKTEIKAGKIPIFWNADLRGANLLVMDLSESDFSNADLSGAIISGADLRCCDFTSADLVDADLTGAKIDGAKFNGADLRGATLPEDVSQHSFGTAKITNLAGPYRQSEDR